MFQSTPPAWGATIVHNCDEPASWFQSTPPAWGATGLPPAGSVIRKVSIHAPRVGGDAQTGAAPLPRPGFNPRPPRGGRRSHSMGWDASFLFQSTPPAWGATEPHLRRTATHGFQSTPPAWGATNSGILYPLRSLFQSTPPAWGATPDARGLYQGQMVSIHAPRVGGDAQRASTSSSAWSFNPRPPRGGRHLRGARAGDQVCFNPRPPRGGRR